MTSLSKPSSSGVKRKLTDISVDAVGSHSPLHSSSSPSSTSSEPSSESEAESKDSSGRGPGAAPDEPQVLSHAEKRRQKKRKLNSGDVEPINVSSESHINSSSAPSKAKKKAGKKGNKSGDSVPESSDALPKRQNSVWVGNLAYKTTAASLKNFFEELEVTRIHMPLKASPSGVGPNVNSGFAYVDFATPDAKLVAITLSERNLEGRRLLIKDGDDFSGRPAKTTAVDGDGATATTPEASASTPGALKTGLTKTARRILSTQKQPPGPTLFFGNLGFEVTEDPIRQLLEAHRKKPVETPTGDHAENLDHGEGDDGSKPVPKGKSLKEDKWIRKIRMGTFEDSGKCKGWAFVDFASTEHATSALVNPRNHSLDGRKLTVEYASPDAVRRGGGPRGPDNHKHKAADGSGGPRQNAKKPKGVGHTREKWDARVDQLQEDGEGKQQRREMEKPESKRPERKRGLGADRSSAGKNLRPRPGAALALAQRGSAAILPSQGQKIKF